MIGFEPFGTICQRQITQGTLCNKQRLLSVCFKRPDASGVSKQPKLYFMLLHSKIIGEGNPFIILHGFLGMGDNWKTLGKRFSENDFQVHIVDQRNHGRSFHSKDFSYSHMVEDLKKYCDYHKLDQIVLLGHSMGGKTAMKFAGTYPKIVSKLIVADISPKAYPLHHQVILEALSALDFSFVKTRKVAEDVLSKYIKEVSMRQFLSKNLYWKYKDELALRINLPVLIENIEEVGRSLDKELVFKGDTLFLKGENSGYIETTDEILIKKHFPKAKIKTISKTGHWLHAENPLEFYSRVMEFLN